MLKLKSDIPVRFRMINIITAVKDMLDELLPLPSQLAKIHRRGYFGDGEGIGLDCDNAGGLNRLPVS